MISSRSSVPLMCITDVPGVPGCARIGALDVNPNSSPPGSASLRRWPRNSRPGRDPCGRTPCGLLASQDFFARSSLANQGDRGVSRGFLTQSRELRVKARQEEIRTRSWKCSKSSASKSRTCSVSSKSKMKNSRPNETTSPGFSGVAPSTCTPRTNTPFREPRGLRQSSSCRRSGGRGHDPWRETDLRF